MGGKTLQKVRCRNQDSAQDSIYIISTSLFKLAQLQKQNIFNREDFSGVSATSYNQTVARWGGDNSAVNGSSSKKNTLCL